MRRERRSGQIWSGKGGFHFSFFFRPPSFILRLLWSLGFPKALNCLVFPALFILILHQVGCGAVGRPIPPEEVGIEAKVQKQRQEASQKKGIPPVEEHDLPTDQPEELPSFFPIGVR